MHRRISSLTTALAVALALGAASASANTLSVDDQRFRAVWSEFSFVFPVFEVVVTCPATFQGSFHGSTFAKTPSRQIGSVTTVTFGPGCTNGTPSVLRESLPWQVQYEAFGGTLPTITSVSIRLVGARVAVGMDGFAGACLATTTSTEPARGSFLVSGGRSTQFALNAASIDLADTSGGILCDLVDQGELRGTASVEDTSGNALGFNLI